MMVTTHPDGSHVVRGDVVTSRASGEKARFLYATRPRRHGKSGKVLVQWLDPLGNPQDGQYEYYDRVFDLAVEEVQL